MDVPRFLVCNLAAADFFMGVYLGNFLLYFSHLMYNVNRTLMLFVHWQTDEISLLLRLS